MKINHSLQRGGLVTQKSTSWICSLIPLDLVYTSDTLKATQPQTLCPDFGA